MVALALVGIVALSMAALALVGILGLVLALRWHRMRGL
jgi:hypothetical protein